MIFYSNSLLALRNKMGAGFTTMVHYKIKFAVFMKQDKFCSPSRRAGEFFFARFASPLVPDITRVPGHLAENKRLC